MHVSRGPVQPFYRRIGGGGTRRGTTEGGAASPAHRGSAVVNRRPRGARALGLGGFGAGEGDLATGRSGPVGALSFGSLRLAGITGQVVGGRCPSTGHNKGGREKRAGIQIKFSLGKL
jgi:hypothetical protein